MHEANALARWNGDGAVRLLARHEKGNSMLLERAIPGKPLANVNADAALDVLVGLLPRLWRPATRPFRALADEAVWWASYLEAAWRRLAQPFDSGLIDTALDAIRSLAPDQGEQVLLHQDLHAANVLSAQREPWLVIDPKPLVGEREFGIAPIVRSKELGHGRADVEYRLDRLTSDLGLDRERARLWTIAQTVAWAFEGDSYLAGHIETAEWLVRA